MVQNPREASSSGSLRPLNPPAPVQVEENESRRPVSITLRGRKFKIVSINDLWEISEEWWRESPVARVYYQVTIEDGRPLTIFRDLLGDLADGSWYRQRA